MRVEDIARLLGGVVHGEGDREIRGVAGLLSAGPDELTYAEGARALESAAGSRAGCILVVKGSSLARRTTVAVANPKLAFIRAAEALLPSRTVTPGIHPTAVVAADAQLARSVSVGPHVVIESGVSVGEHTRLGAGVFLGERARVGAHCVLHPRVSAMGLVSYSPWGCRVGHDLVTKQQQDYTSSLTTSAQREGTEK